MKHIMLDYEDFGKLVDGQIVEKDGVKIALEDIGYMNMDILIEKSIMKKQMNKDERF